VATRRSVARRASNDHHGGLSCDLYAPAQPIDNFREQVLAPSNSSTAAAVTFITFVQDLKKKTKAWGPMIDLCASGEKTLERFRYQFPDDWLYSDQLRGEWSAYNEILKRKNDSIQEQLGLSCRLSPAAIVLKPPLSWAST
jgi:hypothetical protein